MSPSIKTSWVVVAVALVVGTGCGGSSLEGCSGSANIACADFNGDGHTDLAVADPSTKTVSVFLSEDHGTLAAQVSFEAGEGSTLAARDFNADGLVDLQVTNEADGTVSLLMGHGPGGFSVQPE